MPVETTKDFLKYAVPLTLLFPLLSTIIFFLPYSMQDSLKLNVQNPSWWQFATSTFVHDSLNHYMGNMLGFLIFSALFFLLSFHVNQNRSLPLFAAMIFIIPIFVNRFSAFTFSWFLPAVGFSYGMSPAVSAVFGAILCVYLLFLAKRDKQLQTNTLYILLLLFVFSLFLIIYLPYYYNSSLYLGIAVCAWILTLLYMYDIMPLELARTFISLYVREGMGIAQFLLFFAPLAFFACFPLLFPYSPLSKNNFSNFFSHWTGMTLGILFSIYLEPPKKSDFELSGKKLNRL